MKRFLDSGRIWILIIPGFILIFLLAILLIRTPDKSSGINLPEPPEGRPISNPVRKQIAIALKDAIEKPADENIGQLGMIYHSNTFYTEAKECYLKAIEANPDDWRWYYYLGYLCSELGQTENAVTYYKKVTELNPDAFYAAYYMGEACVKLGNISQAEEIFSYLSALPAIDTMQVEGIRNNLYPLKVYVKLSLARLYMDTSRMDAAIENLRSIIREFQDYGPAYRLLSNIYGQLGKEELRIEYNQRANELTQFIPLVDPRFAQLALLSRSDEYILKQIDNAAFAGNQEWAIKLLDHAFFYMPDNPYLISKSIQFYLLYGFGDDIVQKIDRHYNVFSNDLNELAKFATIFNKNGKYGWAIMYYERCNQIKPDDFTILHNLAINYTNAGDKNKAGIIIEKLLKMKPGDTEFLADAASLYIRLGENNKAASLIEKIEKLSPANPVVSKLMAGIALNQDNQESADKYYLKYLNKVPDDFETIRYLGYRYLNNKSWYNAIKHFKRALNYFPNNPDFLEKLGNLYYSCPETGLRDLSQARYYLERAYFNIKSSAETRILAGKNLSAVYAHEKKWEKAISVITTTRIMALRAKYPDQEIMLLTRMLDDYKIKQQGEI